MSIAFEFHVRAAKPTDIEKEATAYAFEQVRGTRHEVRDIQIGVARQPFGVTGDWEARCTAICERRPERSTVDDAS